MVVRSRTGEYFGLANEFHSEYWNDLAPDTIITVQKYSPHFGDGAAHLDLVTRKFRRDGLTLEKTEQLARQELVLNLFTNNEEDFMSTSSNLIKAAKEGGAEAVEAAIKVETARAIHRALWVAEKTDDFAAIPVLQDLEAKYAGVKVKVDPTLTEKDGKAVKLSRSDKVDERVWAAILKKVSKIGAVTKSTANRAECIIQKKEAETFIKAAKSVNGITVE